MKITPIDIRQKTFEKKTFGGIDKDEVSAFLNTISQAWEKLLDENKDLRVRLESAEKEGQKLREVESALYRTLKTAEQSSANLLDQTRKDAELSIKEANMRAESILKDAQWRAKTIIEEAEEEARKTFKALQQEIKALEIEYRTVENQRDNLLTELLNLAKDIEERVNRSLDRTQPSHQPIALSSPGSAARRSNIPKPTPGPSAPPLIDPPVYQSPKAQATSAPIPDAPLFASIAESEQPNSAPEPIEATEEISQAPVQAEVKPAPAKEEKPAAPKSATSTEGSFFDQFNN